MTSRRPSRRFARATAFLLGLALLWLVPVESSRGEDVRESWDAVYIKSKRVGFFHTQVLPVKDNGRDYIRVQVDMYLSFVRNGDPISIETLYGTIETTDGSVLKLDSRTLASKQEMRIFGNVSNGTMALTLEGSGQKQQTTIPWGADVRGPYGAEMSLVRKPITPGETREIKIFIPDLNRVGVARLKAIGIENVTLGGGTKRDLMRVEQVNLLDDKPLPGMTQTLWVDSGGQILRTMNDVFGGMETYRTTKEAATSNIKGSKLDLTAATIIKVKRTINRPTETRLSVFDLNLTGDDLAKVFPNDRRQTLTPGANASTGRLEIKTAGPNDGESKPEEVDPKYLRANTLITSEDARVIGLARTAVKELTDPWQKAVAIEKWVATNIRNKNFETAFAAASEVARDLEGDCTEHGVLTAAMCRAVGVPCRVVIGLLYDEPHKGFGFHMWNEVYVNQRWVAIDSAFDQSEVDAVHVKLSESSLEGVSPQETFLAVVRVIDKLTIEPVEVR